MSPTEPPVPGDSTGQSLACHQVRLALDALAVRTHAIGTLMATFGISADTAGSRLLDKARATGVPVELVARELVAPYAGIADSESPGTSTTG